MTDEVKHTEGPWSFEAVEYGDTVTDDLCIIGPSPNYRIVAQVSRCFQVDRIKNMEQANAHLIAAAPDLLAALQKALAVIDDYLAYEHNGDPWVEDARAMGEMDIDDYERDGGLESARAAVLKATGAA